MTGSIFSRIDASSALRLMMFFLWLIGYVTLKPLCAAGAALLVAGCVNLGRESRGGMAACLLYLILLSLDPEIAQLNGLLAITLIIAGHHPYAAGVCMAGLATNCWVPLFQYSQAWIVLAGVAGFAAALALSNRARPRLLSGLMLAAIAVSGMTGLSLLPTICRTSADAQGATFGDVAEKIIGSKLPEGAHVALESIELPAAALPPTIVLEHDAQLPSATGLAVLGNYSQPRPWSWNQPVGSEVARYWAAHDGCLVTNIGAMVGGQGNMVLGFAGRSGIVPLIVSGTTTFIADSDPLLEFLAPYSQSTLGYFLSPTSYERIVGWAYHALCLLFAVAAMCKAPMPLALAGMSLSLTIFAQAELRERLRPGDIRFSAFPSGWPHDNSAWGVPRSMNKEGYRFTIGRVGATVLCVGPGDSAESAGESLVILSPGSSVRCPDGSSYTAEEAPAGDSEGIPDARRIFVTTAGRTEFLATGTLRCNGITILATGSAGRIKGWRAHLERSQR